MITTYMIYIYIYVLRPTHLDVRDHENISFILIIIIIIIITDIADYVYIYMEYAM